MKLSSKTESRRGRANEQRRTSFTNSGRFAGTGISEDNYSDESRLDDHIRTGRPVPIAEREVKPEEPECVSYYMEPAKLVDL